MKERGICPVCEERRMNFTVEEGWVCDNCLHHITDEPSGVDFDDLVAQLMKSPELQDRAAEYATTMRASALATTLEIYKKFAEVAAKKENIDDFGPEDFSEMIIEGAKMVEAAMQQCATITNDLLAEMHGIARAETNA